MSGIFDDQVFTWKGVDFTIHARQVLGAIAACEEVLTLHELLMFAKRGTAPQARLAKAYGTVLRYAGAKVTDDEIYQASVIGTDGAKMRASIEGLISLMIPKEAPKEKQKGNRQAGALPTLKRRTRQLSSAPNPSAPPNSGA